MRFSLQDVRKSIQRRGGALTIGLHFLHSGELQQEIEHLIAYHERLCGQPQSAFSMDEARACIGEYRLAHCLISTLSSWYSWRSREWSQVVGEYRAHSDLLAMSSPVQLRLEFYSYINQHYYGFLPSQQRSTALQIFAERYQLQVEQLEYLLALDADAEALLVRESEQPPTPQEVVTLYNQWVFEAALFNASSVRFVIDSAAFSAKEAGQDGTVLQSPSLGLGAVIKRLCFLARKLGVYYDLEYETNTLPAGVITPPLILTLYGPQEVTGAPQQYGLRLARLCRLLLGYATTSTYTPSNRAIKKPHLSGAIIEAEARVHFLQRAYTFTMGAELLRLLPATTKHMQESSRAQTEATQLFDSSIEQLFSEAFVALANSQGADGWLLEREPEPLLLEQSIFIPDFALTRAQKRIYVEILGFWTSAYRERKIQKLLQLRGRDDLLLAIPVEAKEAFASIAAAFPIVYYQYQLSATDVLQALRTWYDDFPARLVTIDIESVRERVRRDGFLGERDCYRLLPCYRRSELQQAADLIVKDRNDVCFVPGLGFYDQGWFTRFNHSLLDWMNTALSVSLSEAINEMKRQWSELQGCEAASMEVLFSLCSDIHIRRDSIFDVIVELIPERIQADDASAELPHTNDTPVTSSDEKKSFKPRRAPGVTRKRVVKESELVQGDLWG